MYKPSEIIFGLTDWNSFQLKRSFKIKRKRGKVRRKFSIPKSSILKKNKKYFMVADYSLSLKTLPYMSSPVITYRKFSYLSIVNHFLSNLIPDWERPPMYGYNIRKVRRMLSTLVWKSKDIRNARIFLKGRLKGMDRKEKKTIMINNPMVPRDYHMELKNTFSIPKYGSVGAVLDISSSGNYTKVLKL